MKKEFAERVNDKYDGNKHLCGLKRKLLDVMSEVWVILKANSGIVKGGGEIKMWMWVCLEKES